MSDERKVEGQDKAPRPATARAAAEDPWAGGPPRWLDAAETRPEAGGARLFLIAWLALAVGMLLLLFVALQEADLPAKASAVLAIMTVALAGLCAWVMAWGRPAPQPIDRGPVRRP